MKEQEQGVIKQFPAGLKLLDRLFLEMAVADGDIEEVSRLVKDYGVRMFNG